VCLGGSLVKLRITIRIIRTPRRAGTPLRGAHVLNVMRYFGVTMKFKCSCCDEIIDGIPTFGWNYPIDYLDVP
jgi:hypothetical protein